MPPQLQRLRAHLEPLGLAPAEALALLVLLAGSIALTGVVWWSSAARLPNPEAPAVTPTSLGALFASDAADVPVPDDPSAENARADGSRSADDGPTTVVVHVAGQVHRPGVVSLPAGARVAEAITAAGGPTGAAVLDALNLARVLVDGEQVRVPAEGEESVVSAVPVGPDTGDPAEDAPLDLNTATVADLEALPGIGPVTAERIVAHRDAIGGFVAVTQLLEVPGIGPARFADLEQRVGL